jgi:hypothetical protein
MLEIVAARAQDCPSGFWSIQIAQIARVGVLKDVWLRTPATTLSAMAASLSAAS